MFGALSPFFGLMPLSNALGRVCYVFSVSETVGMWRVDRDTLFTVTVRHASHSVSCHVVVLSSFDGTLVLSCVDSPCCNHCSDNRNVCRNHPCGWKPSDLAYFYFLWNLLHFFFFLLMVVKINVADFYHRRGLYPRPLPFSFHHGSWGLFNILNQGLQYRAQGISVEAVAKTLCVAVSEYVLGMTAE